MKKTKTQEAVEKKRAATKEESYKEEIKSLKSLLEITVQLIKVRQDLSQCDARIIKIYEKSSKRDSRIIIWLFIILWVALTTLNYFLQY